MSVMERATGKGGTALTTGTKAALFVIVIGAICRLLGPSVDWLVSWPDALVLPITEWVGLGVGWVLDVFKPIARFFSYLLNFPMSWASSILGETPWPLVIGM
ncbi:MAG: hypothetical protein ABJO67_01180, partial [Pseudoruegeria sp.]